MPVFVGAAAAGGILLRGLNLLHGYEGVTRLPVRGDGAALGLLVLSAAAAVLLVLLGRLFQKDKGISFEAAFAGGGTLFQTISVLCGLIMCAAGAAGLYGAAMGNPGAPFSASLPQLPQWLLAILTGTCLIGIAAALKRNNITEATASLTIIPMFWACFDMIVTYKSHDGSPAVGLYAFELLAAVFLCYAFYMLAGFLYSTGSPSRFVFSAGLAVFFSLSCVGGAAIALAGQAAIAETAILPLEILMRYACFLAAGVWLFSLLVLLGRNRANA